MLCLIFFIKFFLVYRYLFLIRIRTLFSAINLYFLMNLMLAVVYDAFTAIEVGKFKKLFLHKVTRGFLFPVLLSRSILIRLQLVKIAAAARAPAPAPALALAL